MNFTEDQIGAGFPVREVIRLSINAPISDPRREAQAFAAVERAGPSSRGTK
jgi:hypothetical protein